MTLITVLVFALLVAGILLIYHDSEVIGPMFCIFAAIGLIFVSVGWFKYYAAGPKAEILNREFGTNYTQLEIFYASDVVDIIQQIKRTRIEANGNLLGGTSCAGAVAESKGVGAHNMGQTCKP